MSIKGIIMKEKKVETIKDWLEQKSIKDILVFLRFINFYQHFIKNFNQIILPFFLLLRIISSIINVNTLLR